MTRVKIQVKMLWSWKCRPKSHILAARSARFHSTRKIARRTLVAERALTPRLCNADCQNAAIQTFFSLYHPAELDKSSEEWNSCLREEVEMLPLPRKIVFYSEILILNWMNLLPKTLTSVLPLTPWKSSRTCRWKLLLGYLDITGEEGTDLCANLSILHVYACMFWGSSFKKALLFFVCDRRVVYRGA